MQWLMLQQDKPEDFVIATGVQYSVRDFVNAAARELGMKIHWEGEGVKEKGYLLSPVEGGAASSLSIRAIFAPPKSRPCWAMRARPGQTRLDSEDHFRRIGCRNGARRSEILRAR